ncbi:DUF2254 domain-containing protein [Bacillus timonensis]|nr:DUF2254 domain-containing protein [Bacillus timonensis]
MSLANILVRIRSSFWYLPCLYGFVALLLGIFSIKIDFYLSSQHELYHLLPDVLLSDIDLAQTILSSISASLLTMTTITFSTILVVLTTYLSQFSPRTLQNFITDHSTQRVLGIFVGGFIYSIVLLLLLKETDEQNLFFAPSFAVAIAIICLLVFIFFIHHVTSWIQVSNLIHDITSRTIQTIEKGYQNDKDVHKDAPWDDWEGEDIKHLPSHQLSLPNSGYIRFIDVKGMVKQASKEDCIIRIEKKLGDYIDQDTPLLSIWKTNNKDVEGNYEKYISVGPEKAPIDDIQFGLTKLVEIALRALSPGINDPNTAINSIEQLGKILTKLGKKYLPRPYHNDEKRALRVILDKPTFNDYLYKSFYQIRHYGTEDISVLAAIIQALTLIAESNSKSVKDTVWEFSHYITEGINRDKLLSLDQKYLNNQLQTLARASGHSNDFTHI